MADEAGLAQSQPDKGQVINGAVSNGHNDNMSNGVGGDNNNSTMASDMSAVVKPSHSPGVGTLTHAPHNDIPWYEQRLLHHVYKNTCKCYCSCLCTLFFIFLIITGTGLMNLSEPSDHDWTIADTPTSRDLDALEDAQSKVDSLTGGSSGVTQPRTKIEWTEAMVYMYGHASGATDSSVFTPDNVKVMCELENLVLAHPKYKDLCALDGPGGNCIKQPKSVLRFFYGTQQLESWGYGAWDCTLLTQSQVDAGTTEIHNVLSTGTDVERLEVGFYISESAPTDGFSYAARSQVVFGVPLPGYSSKEDRWQDQRKAYRDALKDVEDDLFDRFGMDYQFFRSAYHDAAATSTMRVRWIAFGLMDEEFLRMSTGDLTLSCSAMFFVFAYIWWHTGSFWLTCTGMAQILLSLPVAFFIYRLIFQITFFTQLHILSVFLVLGIGADDIFVLVDAWKQSAATCTSEKERLYFSYHRASRSVFNTSFTTAFAFGATALSPVMPISSFGIYAAVTIVLNYFFVCTLTPCAVLIYNRRWSKKGKEANAAAKRAAASNDTGSGPTTAAATGVQQGQVPDSQRSDNMQSVHLSPVAMMSARDEPATDDVSDSGDQNEGARAAVVDVASGGAALADGDHSSGAVTPSNVDGGVDAAQANVSPPGSINDDDNAAADDAITASNDDANGASGSGEPVPAAGAYAPGTALEVAANSDTVGVDDRANNDAAVAAVADGTSANGDVTAPPVPVPAPAVGGNDDGAGDGDWQVDTAVDATATQQPAALNAGGLDGPRPAAASISRAGGSTKGLRRSEVFFRDYYVPMLLYKWKGVKVASALILFGFCLYFIFSFVWASKLETPRSQEEWFQSDHMFNKMLDYQKSTFLSAASDSYVKANIAWGIAGIDRGDFVVWEPADHRGTAVFNTAFNLSSPDAQSAFLDVCTELRAMPCDLVGCQSGTSPTTLVLPGGVDCWLETFSTWYTNKTSIATLPTGNTFFEELKLFRASHPEYISNIGFIDGELKFAVLSAELSLQQFQPNYQTKPVYEKVQAYVDDLNARVPSTLGRGQQTSMFWTWMETEQGLVDGMWQGLAICAPVAFIVVCTATDNIILAFYAVMCIFGIVGSVLGAGQHYLGWALGIGESISAVIIIGLSVDFVLHLSHMYAETASPDRDSRVAHAAVTMGVTVIAGAITTLGAGMVMLLCQMTFFTKMATLISLTITFSILTALLPFMAVCALFGPEGDSGKVSLMLKRARNALCGTRQ